MVKTIALLLFLTTIFLTGFDKEVEYMAGHSKWKNIQARKNKVDAKRGKIFTKIGREILTAVKAGRSRFNRKCKVKRCCSKGESK